ncbi:MAG TPA: preprotein translocase subunit SecA [Clostridia bacterium]|nr:preprotein translocase subunit SecA [Clostridia bacterium]NLV33494.1 preprotein translocase subunit SecA [Clostridiaceae bacterium]HQM95820.1 preprotein translocase subunit SecA [Clostridia bacterium]HQO68697.1 preprotein translocase subunit SecA [Clostridia bacterium]
MGKLLDKIFGTHSEQEIKKIMPLVEAIDALAESMKEKTDSELKAYTDIFRKRLEEGQTLDDILVEAFAVCREAATRVLHLTPYKVQLIGGIVLHQGRIAEMKTGEGKTLVATLPVYLNALAGKGVHVVTVNDYLAKRDSEWMGKLYNFLGLSVGLIVYGMSKEEKQKAYNSDLTYCTNNELGFDYLRDNMVTRKEELVQRELQFAIVDEVDSILIDEARTPLIISGAGEQSSDMYKRADNFAKTLKKKVVIEEESGGKLQRIMDMTSGTEDDDYSEDKPDYIVDEKNRTASLTPKGVDKAERYFNVENLTSYENTGLLHHINNAIKAQSVMTRDVDYVVKDNQIIIIDEFTGRMMFGRRYSEGLHQAIEAKENVKVERENKTLATITFQNFFRMYGKLSGMTGTALTEEEEFREIYKLDVIAIPTNRPVIREDYPDVVYKTRKAKLDAIVADIIDCSQRQQPVLIGTISIEKSEELSLLLRRRGIRHEVLNAKHHEREAEIVAQAGKPGAITIATNMAGRGTDIVLGGNAGYMAMQKLKKEIFDESILLQADSYNETEDENVIQARNLYRKYETEFKQLIQEDRKKVLEKGGLYILATERHESRRIDNQLRGRSGRQGDPGMSRFYLSLEDDLMRLFAQDRLSNMMDVLKVPDDIPIEARIITNTIETAQKRIESINFQRRKTVIQYDDVMNTQRNLIYSQRRQVLDGTDMKASYLKMLESVLSRLTEDYCHNQKSSDWNVEAITERLSELMPREYNPVEEINEGLSGYNEKTFLQMLLDSYTLNYEKKEQELGSELLRELERIILLRTVDIHWMDHIDAMDQLRSGIGLRAFGQKDPVMEYKFEGYTMFEEMTNSIQQEALKKIFTIHRQTEVKKEESKIKINAQLAPDDIQKPKTSSQARVGRNDLCPCGSGKKYKKCCGA